MEKLYDMKEEPEKVILVAVSDGDEDKVNESLDELEELVSTAGAITVGRMTQNRERIHPGTYIGKGKIEELKMYIESMEATGIVCDDELSPAQLKNLEDELQTKVMDRTLVILDIFAGRALTKEGKIQVELAQLKYRSARLVGLRSSLSRLGGGIGTRGPGEKKLEIDRRLISDRIAALRREVEEMEKHRNLAREKRSKNSVPVIAIVGYTNAGKSTPFWSLAVRVQVPLVLFTEIVAIEVLSIDHLISPNEAPLGSKFLIESVMELLIPTSVADALNSNPVIGGNSLTVMVDVPTTPSTFAEIVAEPKPLAVTIPFSSTLATLLFELLQVISGYVTSAGVVRTFNRQVSFNTKVLEVGFIVTV